MHSPRKTHRGWSLHNLGQPFPVWLIRCARLFVRFGLDFPRGGAAAFFSDTFACVWGMTHPMIAYYSRWIPWILGTPIVFFTILSQQFCFTIFKLNHLPGIITISAVLTLILVSCWLSDLLANLLWPLHRVLQFYIYSTICFVTKGYWYLILGQCSEFVGYQGLPLPPPLIKKRFIVIMFAFQ